MQNRAEKWWRRFTMQMGIGCVFLTFVVAGLYGCSTTGKPAPDALEEEQSPPFEAVSVEQLEDGRAGFIIREAAEVDEASREDFDRAVDLLTAEEFDQAAVLLEKIVVQSPGVSAPYIDLAIAYRHMGKTNLAEEHLKTALQLVPDHPVACNEYGLLLRKAGRFAKAREVYEKAIARFPDYYLLRRNLGILCDLYLNDPECALKHYELYSETRPEDEQVKLWIVELRNRM